MIFPVKCIPLVALFLIILATESQCNTGHPDCDHYNVIRNIQQVCKSYALLKRSTQGSRFISEFGNNDLGQWPPSRFPNYEFGGAPHQGSTSAWWTFPQTQKQKAKPADSSPDGTPSFLDPIYAEGEEVLVSLERWRRNRDLERKLERFVIHCCLYGCPFPSAYLQLDKETKICSSRSRENETPDT